MVTIFALSSICMNPFISQVQMASLQEQQLQGKETFMVPMRDGVKLATDVYYPAGFNYASDELPVVLVRTPYNKDNFDFVGSLFNLNDFITVIQDMRGRYASEGTDMVFMNASTDGYDTLCWISYQPWCDGNIATYGPSAMGICQFFMHLTDTPLTLKAQAIQMASPTLHNEVIFQGGALRKSLAVGWLGNIGSTFWLPTLYENENYGAFWKNVTLDSYNRVSTPAVFQGGWYDIFIQGIIDGFRGYQLESKSNIRGKSYLIVGPWTHVASESAEQGEIVFPENSVRSLYDTFVLDFFKTYLTDEGNKIGDASSILYYCMGAMEDNATGNLWRETNRWPIESMEIQPFYFRENGQLSQSQSPEVSQSETYYYDPNNPVPTIGGNNLLIDAGPYDQSSIEGRNDVLIFSSEVLTESMEITGPITANLWISSNCSDTDFTCKITDVYPDGRSMLIQDGIVRAKYRNNRTHPELLESGEIVEVEINLASTSYVFNEGHKIRVAISSSNYPRFNANPNNGDRIYSNNETFTAANTLYFESSHPSKINLPINTDPDYTINTTTPTTETTEDNSSLGFFLTMSVLLFLPICFEIIRKKKKLKK
ncbi:MAG: CocE/NonD family hydrolase [Asgard group archaeon]|nr:CocE/NonD family hydrolase [Asgard group archaeon]